MIDTPDPFSDTESTESRVSFKYQKSGTNSGPELF